MAPNPFGAPMGGFGGGINPAISNLDDYVKELDKKIAELEAEEKAQKEKETKKAEEAKQSQINQTPVQEQTNKFTIEHSVIEKNEIIEKTEKDLEKEIEKVLGGEKPKDAINNNMAKSEVINIEENKLPETNKIITKTPVQEIKEEETVKIEEKPKINIDVDSIVVKENETNEDFFDDFFGTEE